jgi:hypothetical protein
MKCRYCKKEFTPTNKAQMYDRPACRVKFSQKKYSRPAKVKATENQKAYAQALMTNDGRTDQAKFAEIYGESNNTAFRAYVAKNSRGVQSLLHDNKELVESTLINTVKDWGDHEKPRQREIAQNAAMYIHDKVEGKATMRIEQRSEIISFNIDLTGGDDEN